VVLNIIKLPPILEEKFDKQVIQSSSKNASTMYKNLSPTTKSLVGIIVKNIYGKDIATLDAEIKSAKTEIKSAKTEIKSAKKEVLKMNKQRIKSIVLLYTKLNMTTTEIAQQLDIDSQEVVDILKVGKVLK
jgi:hypothetical protein